MTEGEKLVAWYRRYGRRFPWRGHDDPYRVWLAEVMLQQTRTVQALPYYLKFLQELGTVEALAAANEAQVLKLWEGMGYYGRGRNLHACAKTIVAEHAGRFPTDVRELEKLKGIGPYTARAIAAFAFRTPVLALDGNGFRVLSRYYADPTPVERGQKHFQNLGDAWVPPDAAGDFNNAVMDLGATVCTPRKPKCDRCPLNDACAAFAVGKPENFPVKNKKTSPPTRYYDCFYVRNGDGFWVRKRPAQGLWGGLWELPMLESQDPSPARAPLFEIKHTLTHVVMRIRVYACDTLPVEEGELKTVDFAEVENLALPRAMRTICQRLQKGRFCRAMF